MLSIAQYTDVACLLEFTVCSSIVPLMDPNILLPSKCYASTLTTHKRTILTSDTKEYQKLVLEVARGRRLPKSLAGRLPPSALAWGILCRDAREKQSEQSTKAEDRAHTLELEQTFQHIGQLLILDRFRPMLLPRHISDLYAANLKASCSRQAASEEQSTLKNYSELEVKLGLSRDDVSTRVAHSSTSAVRNESSGVIASTTVDSRLQAQVYQHLLRHGHVQTPKWLVRQVSYLLTRLAGHDLSAVVDVFVPTNGGSVTQVDLSAASLRLGRALAQSFTNRKPSASSSLPGASSSMIASQMAKLLQTEAFPIEANSNSQDLRSSSSLSPSSSPSHSQFRHTRRQLAILETLWAVLMQLPTEESTGTSYESGIEDIKLWRDKFRLTIVHGLVPSSSGTQLPVSASGTLEVHSTIRRLGALFSCQSPSTTSSLVKLSQIVRWLVLTPLGQVDCKQHCLPSFPIGQLLRVAASDAEVSGGNVLFSTSKRDAIQAMRWISQVLGNMSRFTVTWHDADDSNSETTCMETDGCSILAVSFIHALAPCHFDISGFQYSRHVTQLTDGEVDAESNAKHFMSAPLERISVNHKAASKTTFDMVSEMTRRAEILVEDVLSNSRGGGQGTSACNSSGTSSRAWTSGVSCRLFQWCLRHYLATLSNKASQHGTLLHEAQYCYEAASFSSETFRLVSMVLLPLLCEKCDPAALLLGDDTGTTDAPTSSTQTGNPSKNGTNQILTMIRLVLICTAERFVQLREVEERHNDNLENSREGASNVSELDPSKSIVDPDIHMRNASQILLRMFFGGGSDADAPARQPRSPHTHRQNGRSLSGETADVLHGDDDEDVDMLLTMSSLVLSLLITVLEIGSSRRPKNEEEMIQSFHPILRTLAKWTQVPSQVGAATSTLNKSQSSSTACAGLADMSSYCMALIASRQAESSTEPDANNKNDNRSEATGQLMSRSNKWEEAIASSRHDLQSTQAPIRARGMVSLGKLARGHLGDADTSFKPPSKLIEEIGNPASPTSTGSSTDQPHRSRALEILELATKALLDAESYVFLAVSITSFECFSFVYLASKLPTLRTILFIHPGYPSRCCCWGPTSKGTYSHSGSCCWHRNTENK